jgi:hypothetical protein
MIARAVSTTRRRWPLLVAGLLVLTSVLFAGLWLGAANAGSSRASAFSGVEVNEFDAADSRLQQSPSCATQSWTDLPDATLTFTVGGTTSAPVLVDLSVQVKDYLPAGAIRLLIDSSPDGAGPLRWDPLGNFQEHQPHSYTFLTAALAPGTHTATIQYMKKKPQPYYFCVIHWTLAILHA